MTAKILEFPKPIDSPNVFVAKSSQITGKSR